MIQIAILESKNLLHLATFGTRYVGQWLVKQMGVWYLNVNVIQTMMIFAMDRVRVKSWATTATQIITFSSLPSNRTAHPA